MDLKKFVRKAIAENLASNNLSKYKEIEFVCHNSVSQTSTNKQSQRLLYDDLKLLQNETNYAILPYMQDFSDDEHNELSLAVVILDIENEDKLEKQITSLSKKHNVKIDLYNKRNDKEVDGLIRGDLYDNLV